MPGEPRWKESQGVDLDAERRAWARERADILRRAGRCQAGKLLAERVPGLVCFGFATEVHHRRRTGRGGHLRNPKNHLLVCSQCHRAIHHHPSDARALGFLVGETDPEWDLLGYGHEPAPIEDPDGRRYEG